MSSLPETNETAWAATLTVSNIPTVHSKEVAMNMPSLGGNFNGPVTMSSREIAELYEKRHDHVLRDIEKMLQDIDAPNFGAANCPESFSRLNFELASYLDEQAKNRPMYIIYRDGFMLLVMGYTGKKALAIKLAYIEAFNAMEEELARRSRPAPSAA